MKLYLSRTLFPLLLVLSGCTGQFNLPGFFPHNGNVNQCQVNKIARTVSHVSCNAEAFQFDIRHYSSLGDVIDGESTREFPLSVDGKPTNVVATYYGFDTRSAMESDPENVAAYNDVTATVYAKDPTLRSIVHGESESIQEAYEKARVICHRVQKERLGAP